MDVKLRPHQARFIDDNLDKALLCWEMRVGKSWPAAIWAERRNSNAIVVCPKQLIADWKKLTPFATVYSKEQFKKNWKEITLPSCLVVDEAHTFGSALFTKKRSQLATAMYSFIKANPDLPTLLLSATPIRNDPSSLHTLLCYIGKYIPWDKFRAEFYELTRMPFLRFPAYFPRHDWRLKARSLLEKHADIVSLRDCVEYLPKVTTEVLTAKIPKYNRPEDEIVTWTDEHKHEQQGKAEQIKRLGFRKIIISCKYTAQIDELAKQLSGDRQVFILDGRTKDSAKVKQDAQEADECYLICESSMGVGFEGWMFGALVFASLSHTALSHTQMCGRITSVDHSNPHFIYYLINGRWDRRIHESIIKNEDFNPHKFND